MGKCVYIAVLCLLTFFTKAQNEKLVLKTFNEKGKVYLRWSPADAALFELALKNGYTLEYCTKVQPEDAARFTALPKKKIVFKPLLPKIDSLVKAKPQTPNNLILLQPFASKTAKAEQKKQVFALSVLNAGCNVALANEFCLRYVMEQEGNMLFTVAITNTNYTSKVEFVQLNNVAPKTKPVLSVEEKRAKQVVLKWNAANFTKYHAAYTVLRKDEVGEEHELNAHPLFFMTSKDERNKNDLYYSDTTAEEGKKYTYCILAFNHFALIRDTSNCLEVAVNYNFKPEIKTVQLKGQKDGLALTGTIGFNSEKEKTLVKTGIVMHSTQPLRNYKAITQVEVKPDNTFNALCKPMTGYYVLALISTQGDTVKSIEQYYYAYDTLAPERPTGLTGSMNENGIVNLHWKKNTEKDVKGYKVFYANSMHEEFIELPNAFCMNTAFTDTLTLTVLDSVVYYKIQAVDSSYNHSGLSAVIAIKRPDKLAPTAAVWRSVKVVEKGILLRWNNSTSGDVCQFTLNVYKAGIITRTVQFKLNDTTGTYLDTLVEPGINYRYELVVQDRNGNCSSARSGERKYEPGYRSALMLEKAQVDREKKQIVLSWRSGNENYFKVDVYRKKGDGPVLLYKTLPGNSTGFTDRQLNINNEYTYWVRATTVNGISTKLSEAVVVRY